MTDRADIIAEIGWNHMGSMSLAKTMIEAAKDVGADYAKFQYWQETKLKPGPWDMDGRREIYKKAELNITQLNELKYFCEHIGIKFLCSVFDYNDLKDLETITDEVKIPSHEATNYKLINRAVTKFRKIFLSLGATSEKEKLNTIETYRSESERITVFYCVSVYPMPLHAFKTDTFKMMQNEFGAAGYPVGYSGHHSTIYDAIIALGLGASVIEKHFTTDHNLPGRDNKYALQPRDLESLCWAREEIALGRPRAASKQNSYQDEEREIRNVYKGRWSRRDNKM